VLEAGHHLAVVVVHDHIRAGLDLGDAGERGGPLPCGNPARRADPARDPVRLEQVGD
jgi:hypothetical protein